MPVQQLYFILIFLNFFSLLSILVLLLIFIEHDSIRKNEKEQLDDEIYLKASERTAQLLSSSSKKANKIITNAELRAIKLLAKEKLSSARFVMEYESHVKDLESSLKNRFDKSLADAQGSYDRFINDIEGTMKTKMEENEKNLETRADYFLNQSQSSLNALVSDVHDKVGTQIEKEMVAVRAAVEEYRQRRIKIIDENIIEILEKTLRIALGKKMSLSDQSELIFKALEEAKKEHALT